MSQAVTPLKIRRQSSLSTQPESAPPPETPMRSATGSVQDWFKLRVAYQTFMRENEPLFSALASSTDDSYAILSNGGLADATEVAKRIAFAAARSLNGDTEPKAAEVRPFRIAAATISASAWRAGILATLDVARIAHELAASSAVVDQTIDKSLFEDIKVGSDTSLSMTAMSVTLRLMEPVMTYDYRLDRMDLVATLATRVMETAAEAAKEIIPANASHQDRQTVVQTLASCLATVMAQVYTRKARSFVSHTMSMPEAQKVAFVTGFNPLPDIEQGFRENARVYVGAAYAAARAATEATQSPSSSGPR
jgi:hypothetical protein